MGSDSAEALASPALKLRVGIVLLPEFTLMALTGFIEALRIAGDEIDQSRNLYCGWEIMSPNSALIRSSCGLSVLPTSRLQPPSSFDYVVVIGGLLKAQDQVDPAIYDYVRQAAAKHVPLVGACTGSFLLARAGLLEGRRCCVHQFHAGEFQNEFPSLTVVSDRLFVVDGPRITCPGGASASDVAVHLIQRHCGRDRALKTISLLLFDEARSGSHPQARTALDLSAPVTDPLVRRALLVMQQNVSSTTSIQAIAKMLGTNVKKLERSFKTQLAMSPSAAYRRIRIERALWLVEHTIKSMSEIAYECGFADASHFSRTFRGLFDVAPSVLRAALPPVHIPPIAEARSVMPLVMPD